MRDLTNLAWIVVLALPFLILGIGAHMAGADRRARRANGEGGRRG